MSTPKTQASLQSMSNEEFAQVYKQSRGSASAVACAVGSAWTITASGTKVTCVRVSPKAKSCAFFQDAAGKIYYLKIARDLTPVASK